MSHYIDEFNRRIDIRPDLAIRGLEPRYSLRPCGQYHGTRACAACKAIRHAERCRYWKQWRARKAGKP